MDLIAVDAYAASASQQWTAILRDLIRFDSHFGNEQGASRYVAERVRRIGADPVLVPMDPEVLHHHPDSTEPIGEYDDRNNVVAVLPGKASGGRRLVLNAHLDIHPAGAVDEWNNPPFAADLVDGGTRVVGRGAMDDKAGVAVLLGLMETLTNTGATPDVDLLFQFVLDDETTGNGSLLCLEAGYGGDAAIIVDGTRGNHSIVEHAGNMELEFVASGEPAAVGVSHLGVNAAEQLMSALQKAKAAVDGLNSSRQPPWTEFPSPFQLVVQSLDCGAHRFAVPTAAEARAFVTFAPPHTVASILSVVRAATAGFNGRIAIRPSGFALEPVHGGGTRLVGLLSQASQTLGNGPVRPTPSTGCSDMRHFVRRGIPTCLFGPGRGFNPHRADETYHVDDIVLMVRLLARACDLWARDRDMMPGVSQMPTI